MRRLVHLLLAVWVTVRLLVAPLAPPGLATSVLPISTSAHDMDTPADMDMSADMNMSADMPCCPEQKKTNDCADCPFMALCTLAIAFVAPSEDPGFALRHPLHNVLVAVDDLDLEGLGARP